jgi:hypothetical protein
LDQFTVSGSRCSLVLDDLRFPAHSINLTVSILTVLILTTAVMVLIQQVVKRGLQMAAAAASADVLVAAGYEGAAGLA